jgi:hypothetical protein
VHSANTGGRTSQDTKTNRVSEQHSLSKETIQDIETNRASEGTHGLENAKGRTSYDTEANRASEGYTILTDWREERKGQVRPRKKQSK